MRWFRFYSDALEDPKVQRLPGDLFKTWVNLLCLANKSEERGSLPDVDDIAFALRLDTDTMTAQLEELERRGLLDTGDDGLFPHNWAGRQKASDDVTARVQQHRNKGKDGETLQKRSGNALDKTREETETETEKTRSEHPPVVEGVQGEAAAPPDTDPIQEPVPLGQSKAATRRHEQTFEHFWRVWPKKEGKAKALAAWLRIKPTPDAIQTIIEAVPRHQAAKDWSRENWRFCPNPATWLNEHRWDDELPQEYPHEANGRGGQGRNQRLGDETFRRTVGAAGSHGAGGTDSWSTGPPVRTGGGT